MFIVLFVILTFLHFKATAAIIEPNMEVGPAFTLQQVPFFKTPQSRFPSGMTSLENLEKNQTEHLQRPEVQFYANKTWYSKNDLRPIFPAHISESVIDPKTQKRWRVLETNVDHVLVLNTTTKTTLQFPIFDVAADPYDLGFVMTLKDTYLKDKPQESSKVLTTVPGGHRFSVLKYKDRYAEVSYKNYVGYIPVSEMITKFDFATYIYASKKWNLVKKRNFDTVVTSDDKIFHFSEISGIVTPDSLGLIASKNQKLPLWSKVLTAKKNKTAWIQSRIKGHGTVWWQPREEKMERILTIDDFLKKEIASVSFHPSKPNKGILSSHGVYMTEDGYHWKELKSFGDFHGPVHYFNDNMIFVGNYRTVDQGKTFENYIQIDRLTLAIQEQLGYLPKKLQVKKIETTKPFQLKIEVDTGSRRVHLQSSLFSQDWKAQNN